ncbi:Oxidative stress-responsive serine-rich protein 1 [Larimichthys crocea]|uniref:Oxidative stress-responsive serine-rich protein 1 n=1 Tax=Larimichthys crocea TaxID=215358 RepID=A0A6G0J5P4_LARCR|nr:Oxidative stress-responsive serine-rich protein 1 [Larimichthys crocea]
MEEGGALFPHSEELFPPHSEELFPPHDKELFPPHSEELFPPHSEELFPHGEELSPPHGEELFPPHDEELFPPQREELFPPHDEELFPPHSEELFPPHSEELFPPHRELFPPHSEELFPPHREELFPPHDEELFPPHSEELFPPHSEELFPHDEELFPHDEELFPPHSEELFPHTPAANQTLRSLGGWSERPPPTMEAGGKDCEEETLQTAFKKLRVDAESLPGAVSVSEALAPRVPSRSCLDTSGAKPKLGCPKDNWHGERPETRGAAGSKSPILHPPKFTYCSTSPLPLHCPPSWLPEAAAPGRARRPRSLVLAVDGRTAASVALPPGPGGALFFSHSWPHLSPLFLDLAGSSHRSCGFPPMRSPVITTSSTSAGQDGGSSRDAQSSDESSPEKSACDGAESGAGAPRISGPAEAADFRALSELHSSGSADPRDPCSCAWRKSSDSQEESGQAAESACQCQSSHQGWAGVEVYSFTGLRNVISECERSLPSHEDSPRTLGTNTNAATASSPSSLSSGSPRSCSEQARAYVDDITIEDLSGYMEYYLYIPKKMSHMAEMMYT